jgi:uncharacterized protein
MLKLLIIGVLLYVAYLFVFKKNDSIKKDEEEDTMYECDNCSVFVSSKEVIVKNEKYYCSKGCLK